MITDFSSHRLVTYGEWDSHQRARFRKACNSPSVIVGWRRVIGSIYRPPRCSKRPSCYSITLTYVFCFDCVCYCVCARVRVIGSIYKTPRCSKRLSCCSNTHIFLTFSFISRNSTKNTTKYFPKRTTPSWFGGGICLGSSWQSHFVAHTMQMKPLACWHQLRATHNGKKYAHINTRSTWRKTHRNKCH